MYYYTCEPEWEAMLTCIYEAWSSRRGQQNIRLLVEPVEQITLFDEYIHVDSDPVKAEKVMDSVMSKISTEFYNDLAYASMAFEKDTLDTIFRVMMLGFAFGPKAINMVQYEHVMRLAAIRKRVGNESHHFREFLRFHEVRKSLYVAHIEPKSRIVLSLAPSFADRMPSENWMIVDDVHREAVIHPANSAFYLRKLSEDEYNKLLLTEQENDEYTDMWKVFFDSIAIKERANTKCQNNLFPLWVRKHAVEFL